MKCEYLIKNAINDLKEAIRLNKVEFDGFDGFIEIRVTECKCKEYGKLEKKNKYKIATNIRQSGICETQISFEKFVDFMFSQSPPY